MKLSNTMMIHADLLPSNKKAFTLAEVLITLSILGVVAALTIPSLVNRQSDLAAQVKLKKAIANYENMAAVYMVENEANDLSGLIGTVSADNCKKLSNYFKIVEGPTADSTDGCYFTTSDGAAWYINGDGFATVADSKTSPRYAVSMWTINGQVNGQGVTDGSPNTPETGDPATPDYLTTLYKKDGSSITLTPPDRKLVPATVFMDGTNTYYGSAEGIGVDTDGKVSCAS